MPALNDSQRQSIRNALVATADSTMNSVRARRIGERLLADGWSPPQRWKLRDGDVATITDGKVRVMLRNMGMGTNPGAAKALLDILNSQDVSLA